MADSNETYHKLLELTHRFIKKNERFRKHKMLWWWPMTCKPINPLRIKLYMLVGGHKSTNQHLRYTKLFSDTLWYYEYFDICFVKIGAILDFDPLYKFAMNFDLHMAIILHISKTKHRRCIKLYIFGCLMTNVLWQDKQFDTICREIGACFNFLPAWNFQGQCRPSWKCHNSIS